MTKIRLYLYFIGIWWLYFQLVSCSTGSPGQISLFAWWLHYFFTWEIQVTYNITANFSKNNLLSWPVNTKQHILYLMFQNTAYISLFHNSSVLIYFRKETGWFISMMQLGTSLLYTVKNFYVPLFLVWALK